MEDDQKTAAAIAAVNHYMEMESSGHVHPFVQDRYGRLSARVNMWGVSGRQDQMQARTLMQLRTFNKLKQD